MKHPAFLYDSQYQRSSFGGSSPTFSRARHRTEAGSRDENCDLDLVGRWGPNTLILGPPESVEAFLTFLQPRFEAPIMSWSPGGSLEPSRDEVRTLIIRSVDRLDRVEQQHLLEWLAGRRQRVQVISLSDRELFPLVQNGEFVEALYYRLNILRLNVTAGVRLPGQADLSLSQVFLRLCRHDTHD